MPPGSDPDERQKLSMVGTLMRQNIKVFHHISMVLRRLTICRNSCAVRANCS